WRITLLTVRASLVLGTEDMRSGPPAFRVGSRSPRPMTGSVDTGRGAGGRPGDCKASTWTALATRAGELTCSPTARAAAGNRANDAPLTSVRGLPVLFRGHRRLARARFAARA